MLRVVRHVLRVAGMGSPAMVYISSGRALRVRLLMRAAAWAIFLRLSISELFRHCCSSCGGGVVSIAFLVVASCTYPVADRLGTLGGHRTTLTRLGNGCDILLSGTPALQDATVHGFHNVAQAPAF